MGRLGMLAAAGAAVAAVAAIVRGSRSSSSSPPATPPDPPPPPLVILAPNAPTPRGTSAPAALQALADATAAWPQRSRASDGILGDARHQARKSDHNDGNAFDLTHDPAHGVDGPSIAALALRDPRTRYVIHARRIWNPGSPFNDAIDGPGRPFSGDPHEHHVHVSIKPETRDQIQPWAWAPARGIA